MKILNLYAGIGGNRMLWGNEHEITAVENVPEVAAIYKHLFPNDNVVIDDAHEYLRKHFREFDFIMTQPDNDKAYTDVRDDVRAMEKEYGLDLSQFRGTTDIRKCLRNMVKPADGKFIFEQLTKETKC